MPTGYHVAMRCCLHTRTALCCSTSAALAALLSIPCRRSPTSQSLCQMAPSSVLGGRFCATPPLLALPQAQAIVSRFLPTTDVPPRRGRMLHRALLCHISIVASRVLFLA